MSRLVNRLHLSRFGWLLHLTCRLIGHDHSCTAVCCIHLDRRYCHRCLRWTP